MDNFISFDNILDIPIKLFEVLGKVKFYGNVSVISFWIAMFILTTVVLFILFKARS